jgi:hypothetical protein
LNIYSNIQLSEAFEYFVYDYFVFDYFVFDYFVFDYFGKSIRYSQIYLNISKSIRIFIRIFNIREYSNTRIPEYLKKKHLGKIQFIWEKSDFLGKNPVFRFFPKKKC